MLWPIVAASASPLDEQNSLSGLATPTADDTASTGFEGFSSKGRGNFQDEVKRRDGYKCLFTGYFDLTMPDEMRPDNAIVFVPLEAAHIFKRAVAVVDPGKQYKSTVATLDILHHHCNLDPEIIESLDEPHNRILLEYNSHYYFERMKWCLAPTEREQEGSGRTTRLESPCPTPTLLRMHAALAKVFHASGAAEIFDPFPPEPGSSAGPVIAAEYGSSFAENIVEGKLDVVAAFALAQMSRLGIV
ncbi:hypothetical protein NUW54_g11809 [Trametes sanguinea]|uniref:Uncharacterized protein n=1 Tax=Trametes sanguinea TaxID=158606 RepID=A0ACC1N6R6_9APHY|nr:hypothetical protein NUW54_g11809 [Trametes sanguinea]